MEAIEKECIKELIHEIKLEYSNQMYQQITGDMHFENVPQRLWELWYSDENHRLALCNLDSYYLKFLSGEESIDSMYDAVCKLKEALAEEFKLLEKNK